MEEFVSFIAASHVYLHVKNNCTLGMFLKLNGEYFISTRVECMKRTGADHVACIKDSQTATTTN